MLKWQEYEPPPPKSDPLKYSQGMAVNGLVFYGQKYIDKRGNECVGGVSCCPAHVAAEMADSGKGRPKGNRYITSGNRAQRIREQYATYDIKTKFDRATVIAHIATQYQVTRETVYAALRPKA